MNVQIVYSLVCYTSISLAIKRVGYLLPCPWLGNDHSLSLFERGILMSLRKFVGSIISMLVNFLINLPQNRWSQMYTKQHSLANN